MKKNYQDYYDEIMNLSKKTREKLNEGLHLFKGNDHSHIFDNGFYYGYTYDKIFDMPEKVNAIDILNKKNKIFENPIYKNATDDEKLIVLNVVVHWLESEIFKIKHK